MTENNQNLPVDQTQQTDWNKWMAEQKNKHLAIADMNKASFKALCEKHNIAYAKVYFDGCGDSGQIESYTYYQEDDTEIDIPNGVKAKVLERKCYYKDGAWEDSVEENEYSVVHLVDAIAYNVLEALHPGWEINEGSFGDVIINKDGTGRIEYNERIESTEYSEDTF